MLTEYLNQSLTWEHVLSRNDCNEIATSLITTIEGRKETVNKLIRNAQGEEIVVTHGFYTVSAVTVGDKIDGRVVESCEPQTGLGGDILWYEGYTK